jgi:hypothetical protein
MKRVLPFFVAALLLGAASQPALSQANAQATRAESLVQVASTEAVPVDLIENENPHLFDKYNDIRYNDEKARLDPFATSIRNAPRSQGYYIFYGSPQEPIGVAEGRADRAKNYLLYRRNLNEGEIVLVNGGYRENMTFELWLVPEGAPRPTPTPTVPASKANAATAATNTSRPARYRAEGGRGVGSPISSGTKRAARRRRD